MYNTDPNVIRTIHDDRFRSAEHARLVAAATAANARDGRLSGLLARIGDRFGRGSNSGIGRRRPGSRQLRPAHSGC